MSLIIKKKEYELMSKGLHTVTCTRVEDLGEVETAHGIKDRAASYWTSKTQKGKDGGAVDARISFNKVLGSKSTLGILLDTLGIPATDEFDASDLIGVTAQAMVTHKAGNDKKVYANLTFFPKDTPPVEV